jgi:hypothetical protein
MIVLIKSLMTASTFSTIGLEGGEASRKSSMVRLTGIAGVNMSGTGVGSVAEVVELIVSVVLRLECLNKREFMRIYTQGLRR